MPTGTFFRLPREKQQRLIDAAWDEFTRVPFAKASINRIIQTAQIPRGSFYQYFENKEDLMQLLLQEIKEHIVGELVSCLKDCGGDLYTVPTLALDRLVWKLEGTDYAMKRGVEMLVLNYGSAAMQMFPGPRDFLTPEVRAHLDTSTLRRQDEEYLEDVVFMISAAMVFALMQTLCAPEEWEAQRSALSARVEIIRAGSQRPREENGGETA